MRRHACADGGALRAGQGRGADHAGAFEGRSKAPLGGIFIDIRAWVTKQYSGAGNVAVSVELPEGGFTISQLHVKEVKGRLRITLPLSQRLHPCVTLRGGLKQSVYAAAEAAYRVAQRERLDHTMPETRREGDVPYAK